MRTIFVFSVTGALVTMAGAFLSKVPVGSKSQLGGGVSLESWNWNALNPKVAEKRGPLISEKQTATSQTSFPKESNSQTKVYKLNPNPNYVPLDVISKLKRVKSMQDFVNEFKPQGVKLKAKKGKPSEREHSISSSLLEGGSTSLDSKSRLTYEVEVAAAAGISSDGTSSSVEMEEPPTGCIPRDKLIDAPQPQDMSAILWPACVYAKQCGGCCTNPQFQECVPTAVTKVPTMFFNVPLTGAGFPAPVMIDVIHHAACGCECRVRAADCYPSQTFDKENCQCICARRPTACTSGKQWSNRACDCVCAERYSCSARFVWSDDVCKCACPKQPCQAGSVRDPSTCICLSVMGKSIAKDAIAELSSHELAADAEKASIETTSKRWDIWHGLDERK